MIIFSRRDAFTLKQCAGGSGVCQQDIGPAAKYGSVNSAVLALTAGNANPSWNQAQRVGVDAHYPVIKITRDKVSGRVKESLAHIADRAGRVQPVLLSKICGIAPW
jgi:hypothetical protein